MKAECKADDHDHEDNRNRKKGEDDVLEENYVFSKTHVLFVTNAVIFWWKKLYMNLSSENGAFQRRIFVLIFVCGLHTVETE